MDTKECAPGNHWLQLCCPLLDGTRKKRAMEQSCREHPSKASFQLLKICKRLISPTWFSHYKVKILLLMDCNLYHSSWQITGESQRAKELTSAAFVLADGKH